MHQKLRTNYLSRHLSTESLDKAYDELRTCIHSSISHSFIAKLHVMGNTNASSMDRDAYIKYSHVTQIYRDLHENVRWELVK